MACDFIHIKVNSAFFSDKILYCYNISTQPGCTYIPFLGKFAVQDMLLGKGKKVSFENNSYRSKALKKINTIKINFLRIISYCVFMQ